MIREQLREVMGSLHPEFVSGSRSYWDCYSRVDDVLRAAKNRRDGQLRRLVGGALQTRRIVEGRAASLPLLAAAQVLEMTLRNGRLTYVVSPRPVR